MARQYQQSQNAPRLESDVAEFSAFTGLQEPSQLRAVTRAHIIAWRKALESRSLAPSSIRRKLSALSSLYDYLYERNAVAVNPADGVKRPATNGNEGSTPALGDAQARRLLEAPPPDTLKGVMDRTILATLLYNGIRREELCLLRVRDLRSRQGVMHFRIKGKRDKIRFIPADPMTLRLIAEYLELLAKHGGGLEGEDKDVDGPLFRPVRNNRTGTLDKHLDPGSVYRNIVYKVYEGHGHQRGSCRHRCPFHARDGGHERAVECGRHRQGAGVART